MVVHEIRQSLEWLWSLLRQWGLFRLIRRSFRHLPRLLATLKSQLIRASERWFPPPLFPITRDTNVPDPSSLWSPTLKATRIALPTNSSWLNFVLNEGSMPEYIHPYLIRCKQGALSICYPMCTIGPHAMTQAFVPDITIGSSSSDNDSSPLQKHVITSYDDLSVTLELCGAVQVPLVRGCPYVTFVFNKLRTPTFITEHKVEGLISSREENHTKHKVLLGNGQTWLIYSSSELLLTLEESSIKVAGPYEGHIRVTLLKGDVKAEDVLDEHSLTYPVTGKADLSTRYEVKYVWEKMGPAEKSLLMLSLPIHRDMMAQDDKMDRQKEGTCIRPSVTYDSIDGKMEAIASDTWVLKTPNLSNLMLHSLTGIKDTKDGRELAAILRHDKRGLTPLPDDTVSTYEHGKFLASVAQMALIAEALVSCQDVVMEARELLTACLTPWIEGNSRSSALVYDLKWGGLLPRARTNGSAAHADERAYDDAHHTLGYFCYAGAVLAKLDRSWGESHKAHLYAMAGNYMSLNDDDEHASRVKLAAMARLRLTGRLRMPNRLRHHEDYVFPKLRNFDLWVLHSWAAGGLAESENGRMQLSSSEAVHAYYAGALLGMAFGDSKLENLGLTLASFEIKAAQSLWHISSSSSLYPAYVSNNCMLMVLWANKREFLCPPSTKMDSTKTDTAAQPHAQDVKSLTIDKPTPLHIINTQLYPLVPISEALFKDISFAKELVNWATSFSSTPPPAHATWTLYVLQALYEPREIMIKNAFTLSSSSDYNHLLSILLWWIYSRQCQFQS